MALKSATKRSGRLLAAVLAAIAGGLASSPQACAEGDEPVAIVGARAQPCAPFLRACEEAGFRAQNRGGRNALVSDCLEPMISGQTVFTASGSTITAPSGADAQACQAKRAAIGANR